MNAQNFPYFKDPSAIPNMKANHYVEKVSNNVDLPMFYGKDLKKNWSEHPKFTHFFDKNLKLIAEIGSHFGQSLLPMATDHKDINFCGLDITYKRSYTLAQRAYNKKLENVASFLAQGALVDQIFDKEQLDGIIIFFPDPWNQKEKQKKHRLINQGLVKSLYDSLKPGGFIWLKTDCEDYFSSCMDLFSEVGFIFSKESIPHIFQTDYISCFQARFIERKVPYYSGLFLKI